MLEAFTMVGASFILISSLMVLLWFIYLFQRNASVVDLGWGISFLIAAWSYFFLGSGDLYKMIAITAMATIWAIRLIVHLFLRYRVNREDPRYTRLRERWGGDPHGVLFLMIFLFQGFLVILISLPIFLVDFRSYSEWTKWEFIGIAVWLIGVVGESIADKQLVEFKQNPQNENNVCQRGLWRFSRHPNYFFEFLVWIGFFLFALSSCGGPFGILSPIFMFTLLFKVSGIPLNEEQALSTKGDLYREYQRTTSPFFPWFPSQ